MTKLAADPAISCGSGSRSCSVVVAMHGGLLRLDDGAGDVGAAAAAVGSYRTSAVGLRMCTTDWRRTVRLSLTRTTILRGEGSMACVAGRPSVAEGPQKKHTA